MLVAVQCIFCNQRLEPYSINNHKADGGQIVKSYKITYHEGLAYAFEIVLVDL